MLGSLSKRVGFVFLFVFWFFSSCFGFLLISFCFLGSPCVPALLLFWGETSTPAHNKTRKQKRRYKPSKPFVAFSLHSPFKSSSLVRVSNTSHSNTQKNCFHFVRIPFHSWSFFQSISCCTKRRGATKRVSSFWKKTIGADFWEVDLDSNFSIFGVRQFTEWPGPLQ